MTQQGVPLTGSRNTTIWTVRSVGEGRYQCVSYIVSIFSLDIGFPLPPIKAHDRGWSTCLGPPWAAEFFDGMMHFTVFELTETSHAHL